MSWLSIFKKGEIFTQADRAELERLEEGTREIRRVADKIDRDWPASSSRLDRLREQAEELASKPNDQEILNRLTTTACMPSSFKNGFQHRDVVLGVLNGKIDELMTPQHEVVRRVLRRALSVAEGELKRVEAKEKETARQESYEYVPSGKVLALQSRILSLRNEISRPIPGEENYIQHPGTWRQRLAEYL